MRVRNTETESPANLMITKDTLFSEELIVPEHDVLISS